MPDLMVAEVRREWIGFAVPEDERADSVAQSACDQQGQRAYSKLGVDWTDEKNDDPTHEQKTDIGHQYRDLCKEDGFYSDEKYCQTPDDPE